MGFGPFSSESTATQNTTTLNDAAQLNRQSTVAQGNAKQVGRSGMFAETGSLQVGSKGKFTAPGAYDFSGVKGNVTVTTTDGGLVNDALDSIAALASGFSASLSNVITGANTSSATATAAQTASLEKVLAQLTPLAESKQTDGASGQNKIVLYVVIAIAAAVAFIFWRRR